MVLVFWFPNFLGTNIPREGNWVWFSCSNSALGRSYWPKDSLVTPMLFELWLLWYSSPVSNSSHHPLRYGVPPIGTHISINSLDTIKISVERRIRAIRASTEFYKKWNWNIDQKLPYWTLPWYFFQGPHPPFFNALFNDH